MASITFTKVLLCVFLLVNYFSLLHALITPQWQFHHNLRSCKLNKIFQFGDSLNDAGNLLREPTGEHMMFARPPYGETFFKRPTGRCSNGLLIVDFICTCTNCRLHRIRICLYSFTPLFLWISYDLNDLLMIFLLSFEAWAVGVPLVNPYKDTNASFHNGVNFAVAGASALSPQQLKAKHLFNPQTNSTLNIQVDWFTRYVASICKTKAGTYMHVLYHVI